MRGYQEVIVETFINKGESTDAKIRVRPSAGQGFPTSMRVECSRSMRKNYPVGTRFKLQMKLTSKEGGTEFLYSHYNSSYEVLKD